MHRVVPLKGGFSAIIGSSRGAKRTASPEPYLPPFECPACGLKHHRLSAHGLLRPNAVLGRRALCDGCLEKSGNGA